MRLALIARLAVVAAILCSVGCNSDNKGKIEGTKWSCIEQNMNTKNKGSVLIPAGTVTLEFGADGRLVYKVGPLTFAGTYSLGWGNNVTLKFDQEVEGRRSHVEKISVSGGRLTMTDSDGTALVFEKVGDNKQPTTR